MVTLLQTLLIQTLPSDFDPVFLAYVETVLPAMEQKFGIISVFDKSKDDWFVRSGELETLQQVVRNSNYSEQSQLARILNSLLIAWNLLSFLSTKLALSNDEKRLLCVSFTFQKYGRYHHNKAVSSLLTSDIALGETLNLDAFWVEWRDYLPEIAYLAQTTHQESRGKAISARKATYKIPEHRLKLPLRLLLAFGTTAAQLTSPADVVTEPEGVCLREHLKSLGIDRTLVYHRLRNCTGLLTDQIHNSVLQFAENLNWYPILFFAQGVIYLAPLDYESPDCSALQKFLWEQISDRLSDKILKGEAGFKRDGKGLKAAPQTLKLFSPAQLIRHLPDVIKAYVRNEKDPATPKRLAKLNLSPTERQFLARGADLRSDRLAEFVLFLQKQFFKEDLEFITWILQRLDIHSSITPEQTQASSGSVNQGWYYATAYYIASNPSLSLEDVTAKLQELADRLVLCAGETALLDTQEKSTRDVFYQYLNHYLEVQGWESSKPSFRQELETYLNAKTKVAKQAICSLSSGEFAAADQMDSVVLFKPQQYSNKNPLGGRQLKRGISKIWSLEMLLRQALWSVPAGKLEEQQPVFLYIVPALVHAPQVAEAIRLLVNQLKRVNLWEIRRFWRDHDMDANALRFYPWLRANPDLDENDRQDLPFMAIVHTTTKGRTSADAWVEPVFLAIALPLLLGVKVFATASSVPSYNSSNELQEVVKLDEPASFWSLLGLPTSFTLEERSNEQRHQLDNLLNRLLLAYSIHLDCKSKPPNPRWQTFPVTVRELDTDGLAIFSLARSHLRHSCDNEVQRYWDFAHLWSTGNEVMEQQLELTQRLVQEYRTFYKVHVADSSYAIVLPLSKVLEDILSTPSDVPTETLVVQTLGRLHDTVRRQKPYHRPLIMDDSLSIEIRVKNELLAIQQFVITCVRDLFLGQYKGNRALLQEHRNRIKSGAEVAYRLLAMQDPKPKTKKQQIEGEGA